jgi:predicted secreted hydrolase
MNTSNEKFQAEIVIPYGVGALLKPAEDLVYKPDYAVNSWFAIGHFEVADQILNYLYHLMILPVPGVGQVLQGVVSITNESTGWYRGDDVIVPLEQASIGQEGFDIALSNGRIHGNLHNLHVEAQLADGSGQIDVQLRLASPVILNAGTGIFPMVGTAFHQYSVPRLNTSGVIRIEDQSYQVEGVSWFDRQWQHEPSGPAGDSLNALKWSWMDINLDNGDAISLWSGADQIGAAERAWATILHADGSQSVAAIEPSLGARDYWRSEASGAYYPTQWTVKIPAFAAELEVTPQPRYQEIVSQQPLLHKYEGASQIIGTWLGQAVSGFGYVELVGVWR